MTPVQVLVKRHGNKNNAENDSARLSMILDESNGYSNSYSAIMFHIQGDICYCARTSDKKFIMAKIGEIEITTLPVVPV